MTVNRWFYQFLFLLVVLSAGPKVLADEREIPLANDLAEIAQLSRSRALPTIIFVSREACPYCRTLRDSVLKPMLSANRFEQKALLVEVSLDRVDPITDFNHEVISAKAFADRYQAEITPTLLFLDPDGREIGKRRIGISNLELYGFYLQRSMDEALAVIRTRLQRAL